jgi:hypothetical protein
MHKLRDNLDTPALVVIAITLVLFTLALFTTGFTHDLLLEAAVFLVSVKLIIMSYRSASHAHVVEEKLDRIYSELLHAESLLAESDAGTPRTAE